MTFLLLFGGVVAAAVLWAWIVRRVFVQPWHRIVLEREAQRQAEDLAHERFFAALNAIAESARDRRVH